MTQELSETQPVLKSLLIEGMLSFGVPGPQIELGKLNVLIGPNASGKTNLIEALRLLRAAPSNLAEPVRLTGGIVDWLWKGSRTMHEAHIVACIDTMMPHRVRLEYNLTFGEVGQRFNVSREEILRHVRYSSGPATEVVYSYDYNRRRYEAPSVAGPANALRKKKRTRERAASVIPPDPAQSILSSLRDYQRHYEITYLADLFSKYKFYGDLGVSHRSPIRLPQRTDSPNGYLEEDASNLGVVLSRLFKDKSFEGVFNERLRDFYSGFDKLSLSVEGGTIQLFLHEENLEKAISSYRISDGTLRWICLLVLLLDPEPSPLICIEEPEIGLHPDIIPVLAKLLREASGRTQLVVTTHSVDLVDEFSTSPEVVVICQKDPGGTAMRRLDEKKLAKWLKDYSLGRLWTSGEIGGTRW